MAVSGMQGTGAGQWFPVALPGFMWKLTMSTAVAIASGGFGQGNWETLGEALQYSWFCAYVRLDGLSACPEAITICAVGSFGVAVQGVAVPLPLSWITPRPVMMQFASSVRRASWAKLPAQ